MVSLHPLCIALVLGIGASSAACSQVVVEDDDGPGTSSANGDDYPYTCEGICQRRFDQLGCSLEHCGGGCTDEVIAEIEAVDCHDEFLAWMSCSTDYAVSSKYKDCADGCPESAGEAWAVCQQKLADAEAGNP